MWAHNYRAPIELMSSVLRDESNRGQRVRRIAMAAGWQTWKRVVRKPLRVRAFNGMYFHAYPDCTSSSALMYSRVPNGRAINFLRNNVNGGTFIDVGANVGLISMLLADKVQDALLFEPNPIAAQRARQNVAANRLPFQVYEVALSDTDGFISLEDRGGVNTCNRTVVDFTTPAPTRSVQRATLDQFLRGMSNRTAPVSAVKIDVEGHENAVLRGMMGLLRGQRPGIVMFEYLQRTDLRETLRIFENAGYRVISLSAEGSPIAASIDTAPLQDLFAYPLEQKISVPDTAA